jgi:3-methyladenine DNA glycosylase/8-oxoguanine DNA glycosylase
LRIEIETPPNFRWDRLYRYWGRDPASASEKAERGRLRLGIRLPEGPVAATVENAPGRLICEVGEGGASATTTLRRMFGLELDSGEFEKQIAAGPHARLIEGREGQTVPQVPNVWDGLVWVVAGQQISLAVAFALRWRLTQAVGSRLADDLWAPPSAEQVAALSPEDLYALGYSKAKTSYILAAARAARDGLDFESWRAKEPAEIEAGLLALNGLGPWSVNYLMMRAYGLPDQVPVGDAALVKSLAEFFGLPARPNPRETRELMLPFAPWRSLATFHFWARLEKKPAD